MWNNRYGKKDRDDTSGKQGRNNEAGLHVKFGSCIDISQKDHAPNDELLQTKTTKKDKGAKEEEEITKKKKGRCKKCSIYPCIN